MEESKVEDVLQEIKQEIIKARERLEHLNRVYFSLTHKQPSFKETRWTCGKCGERKKIWFRGFPDPVCPVCVVSKLI